MLPAEGFQPTLAKLVEVLNRLRIRYHLTGGITSVVYGEPRLTQDLDLVLDPERVRELGDEFLNALSDAGFHFGPEMASRAIAVGSDDSAATTRVRRWRSRPENILRCDRVQVLESSED